ncbi:hypothetical protein [Clostridium ganghwense]|uniref:Uncharacterized protein n=1 Tax=Clostridium ganghwense TaxID=312089 RepID=A0ABT4CP31_9CLOT|nr:hypothetical protein [Clostridium ganghwense]MCY6370820.1 hypothetical protein [Clostridium ganghwense]
MNKREIREFLSDNGLNDVEEINYKEEIFMLRFFYDFDKAEISAAKSYATDESDDVENGEVWKEQFFIPYLNDLAEDNVGEIIEEATEEFDLLAQYISYDIDEEEEQNEFIVAFSEEEFDIEDILAELKL